MYCHPILMRTNICMNVQWHWKKYTLQEAGDTFNGHWYTDEVTTNHDKLSLHGGLQWPKLLCGSTNGLVTIQLYQHIFIGSMFGLDKTKDY